MTFEDFLNQLNSRNIYKHPSLKTIIRFLQRNNIELYDGNTELFNFPLSVQSLIDEGTLKLDYYDYSNCFNSHSYFRHHNFNGQKNDISTFSDYVIPKNKNLLKAEKWSTNICYYHVYCINIKNVYNNVITEKILRLIYNCICMDTNNNIVNTLESIYELIWLDVKSNHNFHINMNQLTHTNEPFEELFQKEKTRVISNFMKQIHTKIDEKPESKPKQPEPEVIDLIDDDDDLMDRVSRADERSMKDEEPRPISSGRYNLRSRKK
jgi:hypothetical protein